MADLPPEQSRALAALMLRLHGDFRQRHGLPPLPTAWTLVHDLGTLRPRAALTDPGVLRSRAPVIGGVLTAVRRLMWEILKPVFFRQTEVNRDVLLALEALARDRDERRHADYVLSERMSAVEEAVGRLRARGE